MKTDSISVAIQSLDLHKKIGQMWMANFCGDDSLDFIRHTLRKYRFGGVMLSVNYATFTRDHTAIPNGVSATKSNKELTAWVESIQQIAKEEIGIPVFIGVDQEGGSNRSLLRRDRFSIVPSQLALGLSAEAAELTKTAARIVSKELRAHGFNMIYGPVLDLDANNKNPEVGVRSFGGDPETVSHLGRTYIDAVIDEGIIPCPKHFPGRGRGRQDAHFALETINASIAELTESDLIPFADNQHSPAIMVGHTIYPALDAEHPASLSKKIVTDLLRQQIGFQGIILSDELTMWAIAHNYSVPNACTMAIKAGVDMFFLKAPEHFEITQAKILQAIQEGYISEKQIDESVHRILKLKEAMQIGAIRQNKPPSTQTGSIDFVEHGRIAENLATRTLTLARGSKGKELDPETRILVVVPRDITVIQTNDGITTHDALPRELSQHFNHVEYIVVDQETIPLQVFDVEITARRAHLVVLLVTARELPSSMRSISARLKKNIQQGYNHAIIGLIANHPLIVDQFDPVVSTVLCSFCPGPPQFRAFSNWLVNHANTAQAPINAL